jgi:hypothetical protein
LALWAVANDLAACPFDIPVVRAGQAADARSPAAVPFDRMDGDTGEEEYDRAIDVLERFVAFLGSLTPAELDAVARLADAEVEGFGRAGSFPAETSLEYFISTAGALVKGDTQGDLATLQSQLDELRKQKKSFLNRWPP